MRHSPLRCGKRLCAHPLCVQYQQDIDSNYPIYGPYHYSDLADFWRDAVRSRFPFVCVSALLQRPHLPNLLSVGAREGTVELVWLERDRAGTHHLLDAFSRGHVPAMALILEFVGQNDYSFTTTLGAAARNGHLDMMRLMYSWGDHYVDEAFISAVSAGDVPAAELAYRMGARCVARAWLEASSPTPQITELLVGLMKGRPRLDWLDRERLGKKRRLHDQHRAELDREGVMLELLGSR